MSNPTVDKLDKYALRRIRTGKTKRDREDGAWHRRMQNQSARAAWSNDKKGTAFPSSQCNGKGNSSKAHKSRPGKKVK